MREKFELADTVKGVVVTAVDPGSEAATKGIQPGVVIEAVTQHPVSSPDDLRNALKTAQKSGRQSVLLQLRLGDRKRFLALKIGKD